MRKLIFIFILSANILSAQEILRIDNSISSISYSGTHFLHNWDATNDNITGLIELNDNQILKIALWLILFSHEKSTYIPCHKYLR